MSRRNIVNPDHYKTGGRLTPDEWARERLKQSAALESRLRRRRGLGASWIAQQAARAEATAPTAKAAGRKDRSEKKTERRASEGDKQDTAAGATRRTRSAAAKSTRGAKGSGARGTRKAGSASQSRGSAARAASAKRARRPAAHKSASRTGRKR